MIGPPAPAHICVWELPRSPVVCFSWSQGNRGGNEPELQTLLHRSLCCDPAQPRSAAKEVWSNGDWDGWSASRRKAFKFEFNGRTNFSILKRLLYDLCRADLMISVSGVCTHTGCSPCYHFRLLTSRIFAQQPFMSPCASSARSRGWRGSPSSCIILK